MAVLLLGSLYLRTRHLHVHYWIDEGISVGIASHGLGDIPRLLLEDASPPLYSFILHGWIGLFGASEVATHALSLFFALLCIPAALWVGHGLGGWRTGWICAAAAASEPYLTQYAQETRMYALVVLLSLLCTGAFVRAFVLRRRRWAPGLGLLLAVLFYTHYWAVFFAAASLVALALLARKAEDRRALLRDAAIAYGLPTLLFLPWLPSAIEQARHTGAPWALAPGLGRLTSSLALLLGGPLALIALVVFGGAAAVAVRRRGVRLGAAVGPLLVLGLGTVGAAFLCSLLWPQWAHRYLGVALGPLLALIALGVRRGWRPELAAVLIVAVAWLATTGPVTKSNAANVAHRFARELRPGDLVLSTQPEQVPVLSRYLPLGPLYLTPLGPVKDPGVADWRDAMKRLRRAKAPGRLKKLLDSLPTGTHLLLVTPVVVQPSQWRAPWMRLVRRRSAQWRSVLRHDRRFRAEGSWPKKVKLAAPNPLRGTLYVKRGRGRG